MHYKTGRNHSIKKNVEKFSIKSKEKGETITCTLTELIVVKSLIYAVNHQM